jgi:hypothetical protein
VQITDEEQIQAAKKQKVFSLKNSPTRRLKDSKIDFIRVKCHAKESMKNKDNFLK